MTDLQANVDAAKAALETAAADLAACEKRQREAQAEFEEAERLAPKFTQTDLAMAMARESQARRAGLIP